MLIFRTLSFVTILSIALAPATTIAARAAGTMPACAPGDQVVWENTSSKSKAYHVRGERYFGTTKHGVYACQSDAMKAGYHAAKMRSGKMGDSSDAMPQDAPAASASAMPGAMMSPTPGAMAKHHKRKHHGMMASPDPSAT